MSKGKATKTASDVRIFQFKMELAGWRDTLNQRVWAQIEIGDVTFVTRVVDRFLIFRDSKSKDWASAQFLMRPLPDKIRTALQLMPWFETEYASGNVGRCVLYAPDFALGNGGIYLFFCPEGTGFVVDSDGDLEPITFTWSRGRLLPGRTLAECDTDAMHDVCQSVFDTQVASLLTDPFVPPEARRDQPLEWLCGSEAKLRNLTRAICQSDPELFLEPYAIEARYEADRDQQRVFYLYDATGQGRPLFSSRSMCLCQLVFEQNQFRGELWSHEPEACRESDYSKQRVRVAVTVPPPSAHERAEALNVLAEWLTGEGADLVSLAERRSLLGLDNPMPDGA